MLSLKTNTMPSTVAPAKKRTKSEPEVLEAEILEADFFPLKKRHQGAEAAAVPLPASSGEPRQLAQNQRPGGHDAHGHGASPATIAILVTLLLGAGGYYYVNNQIEPFTADSFGTVTNDLHGARRFVHGLGKS